MANLWWEFSWRWLVVCVIAAQVFGFIWYGPIFGKTYRKEYNITEKDAEKGMKEMPKMMLRETITRVLYFLSLGLLVWLIGTEDKRMVGLIYFIGIISSERSGTLWSPQETWKICLIKTSNKAIATIIALLLYGML